MTTKFVTKVRQIWSSTTIRAIDVEEGDTIKVEDQWAEVLAVHRTEDDMRRTFTGYDFDHSVPKLISTKDNPVNSKTATRHKSPAELTKFLEGGNSTHVVIEVIDYDNAIDGEIPVATMLLRANTLVEVQYKSHGSLHADHQIR